MTSVTEHIGDYQMISASRGCYVYVSYMTTQSGYYNIYVPRINICPADVAADAFVDGNDVVAFGSAYSALDPRADIDQNGQVNAFDIAAFQEAYTCNCGTPP